MKFEFLGDQKPLFEEPFSDFIRNISEAPSKCSPEWIEVNDCDYLRNPLQEFKNHFCRLPKYESLETLKGKTRKDLFIYASIG